MRKLIVLPITLLLVLLTGISVYAKTSYRINYGYNLIENDIVTAMDKEMEYSEYSSGIYSFVCYGDYFFSFNSTKGEIRRKNMDGSGEIIVANNFSYDDMYYDGKIFYIGKSDIIGNNSIYSFDLDTLEIKKYITYNGIITVNEIYDESIYFTVHSVSDVWSMNFNSNKACRLNINTCDVEYIDDSSGMKVIVPKDDKIVILKWSYGDDSKITTVLVYDINSLELDQNTLISSDNNANMGYVGMYDSTVFVFDYRNFRLYAVSNNNYNEVLSFNEYSDYYKARVLPNDEEIYIYFELNDSYFESEAYKTFKYNPVDGILIEVNEYNI